MGMFDISHKISYQRGLVDKDTILDLMSQVEKFPEEEYGDYGEVLEHTDYCIYTEIADVVINADVVEAIPKDQYEARLKADLETTLTDLKLEIEETEVDVDYAQLYYCKLIQQKINALKGDQEGKE